VTGLCLCPISAFGKPSSSIFFQLAPHGRAREAAPSGAPNPARALDRAAADFFLT
jgi:hypothetical protein